MRIYVRWPEVEVELSSPVVIAILQLLSLILYYYITHYIASWG